MEFIKQYKFPVEIVRLDSDEARAAAANGAHFQITMVPTMVVIYEDGNTQLFVGAPKITQWMKMIIARSSARQNPEEPSDRGVTSYLPAGGNMYGPRPNPPRPRYTPDQGKPYGTEEDYISPIESDDLRYGEPRPSRFREVPERRAEARSPIVVEEDEPEEEPEEDTQVSEKKKPKAKKSSKQASSKPISVAPPKKGRSKKKKPPVDFEEVEVEYIEEPPPPVEKESTKRPPTRMKNIYATAKQMEHDRQASLGYREEDLPHY